jgi:hypothetical protein
MDETRVSAGERSGIEVIAEIDAGLRGELISELLFFKEIVSASRR